jgi:regulator of sirC expression with transglutaminase-like and TPR domain
MIASLGRRFAGVVCYTEALVVTPQFVRSFTNAALSPTPDLATAALMIARIEHPTLDAALYLERLDALGREAARRVAISTIVPGDAPPRVDPSSHAQVMALNGYLFNELRFVGNEAQYGDPRNSFLNDVLDRRTGIPITLALVYMEVARRAGVHVEGINFPSHFLLRCPPRRGQPYSESLIIDAFHSGALLSEEACRDLLHRQADDDEGVAESPLRMNATKPQILARMLRNLKRTYVEMHSFPQARDVTELLIAVAPATTSELRDRGLLSYHMQDFSAALRDLQRYLQLAPKNADDDERGERDRIWEHIKTLRRQMASLN